MTQSRFASWSSTRTASTSGSDHCIGQGQDERKTWRHRSAAWSDHRIGQGQAERKTWRHRSAAWSDHRYGRGQDERKTWRHRSAARSELCGKVGERFWLPWLFLSRRQTSDLFLSSQGWRLCVQNRAKKSDFRLKMKSEASRFKNVVKFLDIVVLSPVLSFSL